MTAAKVSKIDGLPVVRWALNSVSTQLGALTVVVKR